MIFKMLVFEEVPDVDMWSYSDDVINICYVLYYILLLSCDNRTHCSKLINFIFNIIYYLLFIKC